MNRAQKIALAVAAVNLALILLFPPFDEFVAGNNRVPIFSGFHFVFGARGTGSVINQGVLVLEGIVVLVNACIAWLLLKARPAPRRRFSYQNMVLVGVAVNLVLVVLFPPFEYAHAVTKASLPTFEGFYFIFSRTAQHTLVATILYIEVFFILVNGALLWLLLREKTAEEVLAEKTFEQLVKRRG